MSTKTILDNVENIKKLDSENMIGSLELLSKQVTDVHRESKKIILPKNYKNIKNILVLGMGGSALGAHLIKSCYLNELKVPLQILNNYHIPKYVNKDTLVVASSYSGGTEEVLSAIKESFKVKAKIIIISSGGKLEGFAKKNKLPSLIFSTDNNPCGSPRMGLGYSIFGQIILFSKLGFIKFNSQILKKVESILKEFDVKFGVEKKFSKNLAKKFALEIKNRSVWYIASEHLEGSAHISANQINENAKRFAGYFILPEMNHHLMEGMLHPYDNSKKLFFILLESDLYDDRIKKRYEVLKKVLKKNKIKFVSYKCLSKERVLDVSEILVFGSYLSYYGAIMEKIDPTDIPFVNYFKAELKK